VQAVTILSRDCRTAAISLRLDLSQPQQTDSHGGNYHLCLYGINANDRGRVRGLCLFVKDRTGYRAIPQTDRAEIEKLPDPSAKY
jgi:hypothetical protein